MLLIVAGLIALSSASEVAVNWNAGFSGNAADQTKTGLETGDVLKFTWSGGHNVYKMASKAAFDSCDFTGGTNLGSSSPVSYTVESSTVYFACEVGSHCQSGQKLGGYFGSDAPASDSNSGSSALHPTAVITLLSAAALAALL
jgi:hypothetical protein